MVRVLLSRLKGERRPQVLDPVFERLPACSGDFRPIWTHLRVIPLCPVDALRLLRSRAVGAGASRAAQCGADHTLIRRLSHLCTVAGIPQRDPGRNRNLFTAHSTRVAGGGLPAQGWGTGMGGQHRGQLVVRPDQAVRQPPGP